MAQDFELKSSFTKRLRRILIIIAGFFIIGIASSYVSSQDFLAGLQSINSANRILSLTNLAVEGLDSSEAALRKLGNSSFQNVKFSFEQSLKLVEQNLFEAIHHAESFPQTRSLLEDGQEALVNYRTSTEKLFRYYQNRNHLRRMGVIKSEILVSEEFSADARESMRMAQINVKERSDQLFERIYYNRFRPLMVAGILSLFSFTFVIVVGLSAARRLAQALFNLEAATSAVGRGNLDFHAPILESDEFGKLTHDFNSMVKSLKKNQLELNWAMDRVTRLQHITSAFSEALLPEQVFEVIFKESFAALNVNSGAVALVDSSGENLEFQRIEGYTNVDQSNWKVVPLSYDAPVTFAVKSQSPIFLSNLQEIGDRFPVIGEIILKAGMKSSCALPLFAEGRVIGALVLGFSEEKEFGADEREFILALSNQCSQALHRSLLYASAREAIKVRDEFLSIASHELRTPLTPLKLQLQSLSRQVKKGKTISIEQVLKTVDSSDKQVNRLTTLIDDLLDVSRISSGRLTLNREVFDLSQMVEEVVSHYRHQLRDNKSQVEVSVEGSLMANLDKVRIEQVLINLLTNAAKYAPGLPIRIYLKRFGSHARLYVQDQGKGVPVKDQQRIFERFERVEGKDNVGGLGLGLYISHQIVQAHDGKIWVESSPETGATFVVDLPLWEEEEK